MTVERGHRAWQVHVEGHLDAARLAADLAQVAAGGGGPTFVLGSAALQGRETSGNNLPFPLISQQWFLLPESLSFRLDGAPVWGLPYRGTEA